MTNRAGARDERARGDGEPPAQRAQHSCQKCFHDEKTLRTRALAPAERRRQSAQAARHLCACEWRLAALALLGGDARPVGAPSKVSRTSLRVLHCSLRARERWRASVGAHGANMSAGRSSATGTAMASGSQVRRRGRVLHSCRISILGRGGSMLVAPDGPLRQNRGPTLPQNDNDAVHVLCFCRLRGRGPQRSMLGVRGGRSLLVHQRGHLGHERF